MSTILTFKTCLLLTLFLILNLPLVEVNATEVCEKPERISEKSILSTTPNSAEDAAEETNDLESDSQFIVETTLGKIKGVEDVSRMGKKLLTFYSIPYAKPPVGELRFEAPLAADTWEGTLDGSKKPPSCAQYNFFTRQAEGVEDCLFLNIYAPKRGKEDKKKLLPVLVNIHGGGFHVGSWVMTSGEYFMDHQIVYVNLNYRLGALGFMDTSDGVVKGNMGLKDQLMALKWIQSNIARFGGNPKMVTIIGGSAGAMSVNYLLASPKAKDLFSKAILQSGTCLSTPWLTRHPENNYKTFSAKFNCTKVNDTKTEIDCLKKMDAITLVNGHNDITVPVLFSPGKFFFPTVELWKDDDSFLTEDPEELLKSGNYNKVPIMAGVAEKEGLMTAAGLSGIPEEIEEAANSFETWAPRLLHYQKDDKISQKIKDFYYGGNSSNITVGENINKTAYLFSDRQFVYGLHKLAKIHSANAPLFLYYNTFVSNHSVAEMFKTSNQTFAGNGHGDDGLLFAPFIKLIPGSRMYNLSLDMVDLYSQFINEDWMSIRTVPWWQVNPNRSKMTYLKVDDIPEIVEGPFEDRMKFWESLEGEIKHI